MENSKIKTEKERKNNLQSLVNTWNRGIFKNLKIVLTNSVKCGSIIV